jgi:hypothetical protein
VKVWELSLYVVVTKKNPDLWEDWATRCVVAETLEEAIQKLVEVEKKNFYKIRVQEAKLLCEVDIE